MKIFFTLTFFLIAVSLYAQVLSDEHVLKVIDRPLITYYCGTGYTKINENGESIYVLPTVPINHEFNELVTYGHGQIPQLMRLEKHLKNSPATLINLLGKIARPQDIEDIEYLENLAAIKPFEKNEWAHAAQSALEEIRERVDF